MTTQPAVTSTPEARERHLGMQELAEREGVALQTIRAWRTTGYGPRGFKVGRLVRYRLEDVLAWEAEQLAKEEAHDAR